MQTTKTAVKNAGEYVKQFPADVQPVLERLRKTIKAAAPKAEELISYQMPAYKYHGMLVYFAAWKNHIGFYPAGAIKAFDKELSVYEVSKGTIRFPLDKSFPFSLVSKMVRYRAKENEERALVKEDLKKAGKKNPVKV